MEEIDRNQSMSLYSNENGEEEYMLESLGVAYKLGDNAIWFVKVPMSEGEPERGNAVMVRVEDEPTDHEERPDELLVTEAVDSLVDWYNSR